MNETEETETELETLKTRLVSLKKELVKEGKIVNEKEKEINNNPEMKKLIEEQKMLKEEKTTIERQKEKLEKKIKEQFFEMKPGWSYPNFQHKTYAWSEETNIWDDVLEEIGKHSPLYLLRNEDIENAVKILIEKAINKCPELVELTRQYRVLSNKIDELRHKERKLDEELREGFHSKVYGLRGTISGIEQQIANPKKYVEKEKRLNKRDVARNKLRDQKVLNEIYKRLDIKIPKVKT